VLIFLFDNFHVAGMVVKTKKRDTLSQKLRRRRFSEDATIHSHTGKLDRETARALHPLRFLIAKFIVGSPPQREGQVEWHLTQARANR